MKRTRLTETATRPLALTARIALVLLAAGGVLWALAGGGFDVARAQPADALAAKTPTDGAEATTYGEARRAGFKLALEGRFEDALSRFKVAAGKAPDGETSCRSAVKLLTRYLDRADRAAAQRREEYEQAVSRVKLAMLAHAHRDALAEQELAETFHDIVYDKVADAYNQAQSASALEDANQQRLEELRPETVAKLAESVDAVDQAVEMLGDDKSVYARRFAEIAQAYVKAVGRYTEAWNAISLKTPADRIASLRRLRDVEEQVTDALAELELMVVDKPWRSGLAQARLAKDLAENASQVETRPWYRSLVGTCERIAQHSMDEAEWYDALSAYTGLEELDDANAAYDLGSRQAQRHVRVLRLYGQEDDPNDVDPGLDYKDLTRGIDSKMVENAISRMSGAYVTAIDYKKLTRSALDGIRILAETPQAAKSFPALGDEAKKRQFVSAIKRAMDQVDRETRPDNFTLQQALWKVLFASEESIEIPTSVLAMEFTDGFLSELDRFSSMIWPQEVENFTKQTMGRFIGIGVQIAKPAEQPLRVVTPLAGSPAYKAGLKVKDEILKVDGKSTIPLSIDTLIRMITGEENTTVTLTIQRPGVSKPFDVDVVRKQIHIATVKGWRRHSDGSWDYTVDPAGRIGYVRLTQFTDKTIGHIRDALRELDGRDVKSLVLDLRFNPGGLLRSARDVASEFIPTDETVVTTRGRQMPNSVLKARRGGRYVEGELIVLVNEYSASAAEILSGALKDWKRATIVGARSYGKGSVQNVIDVHRQKAFLKLTTAYYYLPSGRLLHRRDGAKTWGVDPHIPVPLTPRQTRRWQTIQRKTDLIQDIDPEELTRELDRQLEVDYQLNTAMLLLQLMDLRDNPGVATAAKTDS